MVSILYCDCKPESMLYPGASSLTSSERSNSVPVMNLKYASLLILFLLTLFRIMVSPAYAFDIKGIYEAEVPVFKQGKKERKQAMRSGLLEVLIKVSGSSEIPLTPGIPDVLDKAASYVQQYRYRSWPADRPVPRVAEGKKPPKRVLWVRYDKQAINKILQNQGFPIWGRSRPSVLIWLAVEDEGKRYLLGNDNEELISLVQHEAKKRGLPVMFPLLDLQDQSAIRVFDVWGDFQEEILQASGRYQTEAVLSGRLFRDNYEGWRAKWTLYEDGNREDWESAGVSQNVVFADAIDGAASVLSTKYAQIVDESTRDAFFITVKGVNSLADYARIARYLTSLASVEHASAVQFDASNTIYRLDINGVEQGVVRTIDLGNVLVAVQQDQLSMGPQLPNRVDRVYQLLQ